LLSNSLTNTWEKPGIAKILIKSWMLMIFWVKYTKNANKKIWVFIFILKCVGVKLKTNK